jgi:hypothetical protein
MKILSLIFISTISFLITLERSRVFSITDPRDKAFALVGVIRSWERKEMPLVINHNLSTAQDYTNVAKHIIHEWHSLDFICESILGDANPQHNLPSWLPDYSSHSSVGEFPRTPESTTVDYCYLNPPVFLENDIVLQVQGFRVDKILHPYLQLPSKNPS